MANIQDIIASPAVDHLTGADGGGTTFFLAPNQGAGSTIAGSGGMALIRYRMVVDSLVLGSGLAGARVRGPNTSWVRGRQRRLP